LPGAGIVETPDRNEDEIGQITHQPDLGRRHDAPALNRPALTASPPRLVNVEIASSIVLDMRELVSDGSANKQGFYRQGFRAT
jgi:hypothetical protein